MGIYLFRTIASTVFGFSEFHAFSLAEALHTDVRVGEKCN